MFLERSNALFTVKNTYKMVSTWIYVYIHTYQIIRYPQKKKIKIKDKGDKEQAAKTSTKKKYRCQLPVWACTIEGNPPLQPQRTD